MADKKNREPRSLITVIPPIGLAEMAKVTAEQMEDTAVRDNLGKLFDMPLVPVDGDPVAEKYGLKAYDGYYMYANEPRGETVPIRTRFYATDSNGELPKTMGDLNEVVNELLAVESESVPGVDVHDVSNFFYVAERFGLVVLGSTRAVQKKVRDGAGIDMTEFCRDMDGLGIDSVVAPNFVLNYGDATIGERTKIDQTFGGARRIMCLACDRSPEDKFRVITTDHK